MRQLCVMWFSALVLAASMFTTAPAWAESGDEASPVRAGGQSVEWAPMWLWVDARDADRGLIHSTMLLEVEEPGPLDLYYTEWTPGNHNPSGPIQNVVSFYVRDEDGAPIRWKRDPTHVVRVTADVPEGVERITIKMSYIVNQPSVISRSTDSYGYPSFGALNWNTSLVYPGGADKDEFLINPVLSLPSGWEFATALRTRTDARAERAGQHAFERVSLAKLIDSPVIYGEHKRSWRLDAKVGEPHFIDAVAAEEESLELPDARLDKFAKVVEQSVTVFGPFPFDHYHFLLVVDSRMPGIGLEHRESTFITARTDELVNSEKEDGDPMTVVPHEYVHVWCGKLRAPEGLLHRDYHTPGHTELMWVYEGLTTYYTDVIAVRSGLLDFEAFKDRLASRIARYETQQGRRWRSVEDTGSALRFLRAGSPRWQNLRRRQDYYSEGALVWMTADAIMRRKTNGEASIDLFSSRFFDVPAGPAGSPVVFDRTEVIETLEDVYPGVDWDAFIRERIETPRQDLEFDLPERLGYRLVYTNEPTEEQKKSNSWKRGTGYQTSLGFNVDQDSGEIGSMVFDSPAYNAGIGPGMTIVAVGEEVFSTEALRNAVQASPETGNVTLLVNVDGSQIKRFKIKYDGGLRLPRLKRDEGLGPDILKAIAEPR